MLRKRAEPMPEPTDLSLGALLKQAIKAVPSVKWAVGVGGIAAVIAIVTKFQTDLRAAVLDVVVMLVLMTMLVIFSKVARQKESQFRIPVAIFTWFCLLLFISTGVTIFVNSIHQKSADAGQKKSMHAQVLPQPEKPFGESVKSNGERMQQNVADALANVNERKGDLEAEVAILQEYCSVNGLLPAPNSPGSRDCIGRFHGIPLEENDPTKYWNLAKYYWLQASMMSADRAQTARLHAKLSEA